MDHEQNDEDRLREIIAEVNRHAMFDGLRPHEEAKLREILPQLVELIESKRRTQWLWKRIGAFLLAAPALGVAWQGAIKLLEWIRGQ